MCVGVYVCFSLWIKLIKALTHLQVSQESTTAGGQELNREGEMTNMMMMVVG